MCETNLPTRIELEEVAKLADLALKYNGLHCYNGNSKKGYKLTIVNSEDDLPGYVAVSYDNFDIHGANDIDNYKRTCGEIWTVLKKTFGKDAVRMSKVRPDTFIVEPPSVVKEKE